MHVNVLHEPPTRCACDAPTPVFGNITRVTYCFDCGLDLCAFDRVEPVVAGQLERDDIGALGHDETGFIGWCRCGHRTLVRYSWIAAQSAVASHVLEQDARVTS